MEVCYVHLGLEDWKCNVIYTTPQIVDSFKPPSIWKGRNLAFSQFSLKKQAGYPRFLKQLFRCLNLIIFEKKEGPKTIFSGFAAKNSAFFERIVKFYPRKLFIYCAIIIHINSSKNWFFTIFTIFWLGKFSSKNST